MILVASCRHSLVEPEATERTKDKAQYEIHVLHLLVKAVFHSDLLIIGRTMLLI